MIALTSHGFLLVGIEAALGMLAVMVTVAIAGPVNPPPHRGDENRPSQSVGEVASGCGDCTAWGGPCRYHRGFAAGWTARWHHDHATSAEAASGTTGPTSTKSLGRTA